MPTLTLPSTTFERFDMSDNSDPESHTKRNEAGEHLEVIRTISRVPDNPNYYEKNGLRTEGDGMDHEQYNPVCLLQQQLLCHG